MVRKRFQEAHSYTYQRHRAVQTLMYQLVEHHYSGSPFTSRDVAAKALKKTSLKNFLSVAALSMAESANLLVEDVLIGYPTRQWVSSLATPLKLLTGP